MIVFNKQNRTHICYTDEMSINALIELMEAFEAMGYEANTTRLYR